MIRNLRVRSIAFFPAILLMLFVSFPIQADLESLNNDLKNIVMKEKTEQEDTSARDIEDIIEDSKRFTQVFDDTLEYGFDCDSLCGRDNEKQIYKVPSDCIDTCENAGVKVRENRSQAPCNKPENMELIPAGSYLKYPADAFFTPSLFFPTVVFISDDFFMDKYEVPQNDFKKVMGFNPAYYQGKKCGDNCPVENITWDEADAYCKALGKRLPTASEWEYAAKAGTSTLHYWDDELNQDYLWYKYNSGGRPKPVGQKLPNRYGLHDMEGNVFEYVQDCGPYTVEFYRPQNWHTYVNDSIMTTFLDPVILDGHCETRIIKGGSFAYEGKATAPHFDYYQEVNERRGDRGFRCVMDAYGPQCQQATE